MDKKPCSLYILYSESLNRHYIGTSDNPRIRVKYHNSFPKGWTRRGRPWELVFFKEFPSKQIAQRWERWLKKQKSRTLIEKIIRGDFQW